MEDKQSNGLQLASDVERTKNKKGENKVCSANKIMESEEEDYGPKCT